MQAKRGLTGIMNYTNPGAISHNEIMELYKSYVDPEFSWKNFSVEEQAEVIKAPRSNNLLDTARVRVPETPLYIAHSSALAQGLLLLWLPTMSVPCLSAFRSRACPLGGRHVEDRATPCMHDTMR